MMAGKIFLLLAMATLYTGIVLFMGIPLRRNILLRLLIAFAFVFSYNFWLGNINFVMGLGVALCSIYLLIERKWIERFLPTAVLLLLCYCCHFFSLCIVGLSVLIYLGVSGNRIGVRRFAVAAFPVVGLFIHYILHVDASISDSVIALGAMTQVRERLAMFAGVLIPFQRFKGVNEPSIALKVVNYLYLTGLGGLIVFVFVDAVRARSRVVNTVIALLVFPLIFLLPLYTSGIVYPGERLVLFLIINVLVVAILRLPGIVPVLSVWFFVMNIAIYAYAWINTSRFDAMVVSGVIPSSEQMLVYRGKGGSDGLIRLNFYEALEYPSTRLSIFQSGLFHRSDLDSIRTRRHVQ